MDVNAGRGEGLGADVRSGMPAASPHGGRRPVGATSAHQSTSTAFPRGGRGRRARRTQGKDRVARALLQARRVRTDRDCVLPDRDCVLAGTSRPQGFPAPGEVMDAAPTAQGWTAVTSHVRTWDSCVLREVPTHRSSSSRRVQPSTDAARAAGKEDHAQRRRRCGRRKGRVSGLPAPRTLLLAALRCS